MELLFLVGSTLAISSDQSRAHRGLPVKSRDQKGDSNESNPQHPSIHPCWNPVPDGYLPRGNHLHSPVIPIANAPYLERLANGCADPSGHRSNRNPIHRRPRHANPHRRSHGGPHPHPLTNRHGPAEELLRICRRTLVPAKQRWSAVCWLHEARRADG